MKSLQRMFSGRKEKAGDQPSSPQSAYQTPANSSGNDLKQQKSKSFWKRISPRSVSSFFSKSSNRSGEESRPNSPPVPVMNSPSNESPNRPNSHRSSSVDSLDLRADVPRIKLHERPLSPEDMGMVRYEDEDDDEYQHHASPPSYQGANTHSAQSQHSHQQQQNDPHRFGSSNRSDSLGIQYVDADDDSSDEDEDFSAHLKGGADQGYHQERNALHHQSPNSTGPAPGARKSSHNISQHAIDELLGMSTKSHHDAHPQQQRATYQNQTREEQASERDGGTIFAISSDIESELDTNQVQPQRLFAGRAQQPAYELTRPLSLNTTRTPPQQQGNILSPQSPSTQTAAHRVATPRDDRAGSNPVNSPPPLLHANIHQTVPFENTADAQPSPAATERGHYFAPEISPTDTNEVTRQARQVVATPPAASTPAVPAARNPSPQRLPSRRVQMQVPVASSSNGSVNNTTGSAGNRSSSNNRPGVVTRQRSNRRPLATSSSELVGPGAISVLPLGRRSQDDRDIDTARRRSMSPGGATNVLNNMNNSNSNNRLSSHSNSTQSQSQYNLNVSSMSAGNLPAASQSMYNSNTMMMPNNMSMMNMNQHQANNLALQQAILQQQQMQQLQQQQLQQLQQQQQQLQLMAAMGMTTVPMVANNGMIYQQPIMTVLQNNAIAMNNLTNSLTAIAASLALIAVPAATSAVVPVTVPGLAANSLGSASGLITTNLTNTVSSNNAANLNASNLVSSAGVVTTSLEEQLLSRQRQVEMENEMQLRMAIEQSLHEVCRPQTRRTSMSSMSSSMSSITNNNNTSSNNMTGAIRSSSQPRGQMNMSSSMLNTTNSTTSSATSGNTAGNNHQQQQQRAMMEDADDAALQMALMMSLEEQHHEQQSAIQEVYEFSLGRSRSPPIREQQAAILSRQASRHVSRQPSPMVRATAADDHHYPPLPHNNNSNNSHSHSHSNSSYNSPYYESHVSNNNNNNNNSRAPSRERLINFQRRTREEILLERASRSASPAAAHANSSGVTTRAASNHSSFHGHMDEYQHAQQQQHFHQHQQQQQSQPPQYSSSPSPNTAAAAAAAATQQLPPLSPQPGNHNIVVGSSKVMVKIPSFHSQHSNHNSNSSNNNNNSRYASPQVSPPPPPPPAYEYTVPPPAYEDSNINNNGGVRTKTLIRRSASNDRGGRPIAS